MDGCMHADFSPFNVGNCVYAYFSPHFQGRLYIFQHNIVKAIGPRNLVHEHMVLSHQCLRKICSYMPLPKHTVQTVELARSSPTISYTRARALFLRSAFCRVYAYTLATASVERGDTPQKHDRSTTHEH